MTEEDLLLSETNGRRILPMGGIRPHVLNDDGLGELGFDMFPGAAITVPTGADLFVKRLAQANGVRRKI